MRRSRGIALVLAGAISAAMLVGVAQATSSDACEKAYTAPMNSTAKLKAYEDCRFDRIDAAQKRIEARLDSPSPTPSPTGPPTTASPAPTVAPTTPPPTPDPTTPAPTVPPSTDKPGPTNTGVPAGTTLTKYTGPLTITTAGTVIDSKDVTGALVISAKNVVIKNSKVHDDPGATAGINVQDTGSVTITDTEIYNFQVGIVYTNWTAIRVDIHDITFDGIKMSSNARLQDSWIHAPKPQADAHWDGVQVQNGVTNTVIQHNVIDPGDVDTNSALFLCPDLGPSTDGPLTVTGNWLNGGNYTVNVLDGNNGKYFIKNITVTDNRFGNNFKYGRSNVNVPITQSGNVIDSTGAPYTL